MARAAEAKSGAAGKMRVVDENKVVVMTVNLWKITKGCSFVRLADSAVARLRKEVRKQFQTDADVKIDMDLNKALWGRGRRNIPSKVRVEITRRPCPRDSSKTEFVVRHVVVPAFKGLLSESAVQS